MTRDHLVRYLDEYLEVDRLRDYCPNGLQVEGRAEIRRVATGVTASLAFLQKAAEWGADAVVVHHGIFWNGGDGTRLVRSLRARVAALLASEMSLLAYHLPLDRHLVVGNNAVLARHLGATGVAPGFLHEGEPIGVIGTLPDPLPVGDFVARISAAVMRDPLVIASGPASLTRFGVVSGGGPRYFETAIRAGLDLFLTGEPAEHAIHLSREEGVHFVAAGHHATERFGPQALAAHLALQLELETTYIEIANPA